jgi:colanic acid biosynthesis glycosyl transferase WcaI
VVAYSGNLGRAHEYQTILNAAQILRRRDDIIFLFIGGGALLSELMRDVKSRQLGANFIFKPYHPHESLGVSLTLPDALWLSLNPDLDGLIVPSKFYGACAAGRPIIFVGDPNNELAKLIEENHCGTVVPTGASEKLSAHILELAGDPAKVETQGANARALVEERFSRKDALETWSNELLSIINES